jgi:hypothetical protein
MSNNNVLSIEFRLNYLEERVEDLETEVKSLKAQLIDLIYAEEK